MASNSQADPGKVTLKVDYRGDMRRARVNVNDFSFDDLVALCSASYTDELKDNVVTALTYKDDEDETITVCSNPELAEAFRIASSEGRPSLRLTVSAWSAKKAQAKKAQAKKAQAKKAQAKQAASAGSAGGESKRQQQQQQRWRPKVCKVAKPSKPVPLRTVSGGAKLFLDGSVEFGAGGHAVLLPDGTVSCVMTGSGFPSVAAQGLLLTSGKWYHEVSVLTSGCMQVGYATKDFTGNAEAGEGVGDDKHSWAIDGYRQLKWHDSKKTPWAAKWHDGAVVGCCIDVDKGEIRFAVNGCWGAKDVAFAGVDNKNGFIPACSFSNGERMRFNFGAPGTPFTFSPPDVSFKPVWEAFGTSHNGIGPVTSRPALFSKKASELCARAKAAYTKVDGQALKASSRVTKECENAMNAASVTVAELLSRSGVRDAISKALANPEVSKFIQTVLVASMKSRRAAEQAIQRNVDKVVPVIIDLVSKCPELLATVPQMMQLAMRKGSKSCRNWRKQHCKATDFNLNRLFSNVSKRSQDVAGLIVQWLGTAAATSASAPASVRSGTSSSTQQGSKTQDVSEAEADKDLQAAIEQSLKQNSVSASPSPSPSSGPGLGPTASASSPVSGSNGSTAFVALPVLSSPSNGALPLASDTMRPKARFLKEFSSANKKELEVGQRFTHTWLLVNNGVQAWPGGVVAKRTTGDKMKGTEVVIPVAPAAANTTIDVKLDIVAPSEPGRYISYWRLFTSDQQAFGDRIWIDMTVKAAKAGAAADASADADADADVDADADADTSADAVEGLTDWALVADSMRASGSGIPETLLNAASSKSESKEAGPSNSNSCAAVGIKTIEPGPLPTASTISAAALASAAASATNTAASSAVFSSSSSKDGLEDLDSKFSKQMKMMESMGFGEERDMVLAMLEATNGDIGQAVNHILASKTSS